MNEPTPLELMQFADGESSAEDAERIAEWLETSPRGRAMLESLDRVGDLVRAAAEQQSRAFDVADDIARRIEQEPARLKGAPPREQPPARAGKVRRVVPLFAAVTAFAAAAAVGLLLRHGGEPRLAPPTVPAVSDTVSVLVPPATDPVSRLEDEDDAPGAEIEAIDFGGESGTIFMVKGGTDRTPVVWLVDEGDENGARMEPL